MKHTINNLKIRSVFLILGLALGLILNFVLNLAWYFFKLIVLGYGHSAPEWFITVHERIEIILLIISVCSGLIASQILYRSAFQKRTKMKN